MEQKFDVNKMISHLKVKWGNRHCPMCEENNWTVSDKIFELREYYGGDMVIGTGQITPVVPIICGKCGNTVLVNALISNVITNPNLDKK